MKGPQHPMGLVLRHFRKRLLWAMRGNRNRGLQVIINSVVLESQHITLPSQSTKLVLISTV